MKLLLGQLYKIVYINAKLPPDYVQTIHEGMLKGLAGAPLGKSSDPAISDVLSDETFHQIGGVEAGYEVAWKRRSENPV